MGKKIAATEPASKPRRIGDEHIALWIVRLPVRTILSDLGGYFSFSSVMDGSLFGRESCRACDSIDRQCAEGMTPDLYRQVYWTMVLLNTLV